MVDASETRRSRRPAWLSGGFFAGMRIRKKLMFLHTVFSIGLAMILLIAIGFVMKTMPQINVLTIGFAVKIVAGLTMLAICIFALEQVFMVDLEETLDIILRWAADPGA